MMEAAVALCLQSYSSIGFEKFGAGNGRFLRLPKGFSKEISLQIRDRERCRASNRSRRLELKLSCSCNRSGVSAAGSENFHDSGDEPLILKRKAKDVTPYLNGRCVYLVGMMGSGKTTVGKILSEVLGYSFFDSDKLVEQAVGISSVAQIFKEHSEAFFRDSESKVLRNLSSMRRLVVATGGGAVIRPLNWRYMKQGITVWLDVPLEALARRIAAAGTDSRPLLHAESGDPYTKAFMRLTALSEQRGKAYTNADARVSLEYIAAKQGYGDVCKLTPTAIAIEALTRIESFLTEKAVAERSSFLQG